MIGNGARIIPKGSSLVPIKGNSFSERLVDVELVPGGGMNLETFLHIYLFRLHFFGCMHFKMELWVKTGIRHVLLCEAGGGIFFNV